MDMSWIGRCSRKKREPLPWRVMSDGKVDWVSISVMLGSKWKIEITERFDTSTCARRVETTSSIAGIGNIVDIVVVEIKVMIPAIDVVKDAMKMVEANFVLCKSHIHDLDDDGWFDNESGPKCWLSAVARIEVN